jgi:hypothetical protein
MTATAQLEHRLAVITNWAFFACFGFSFALSGFTDDNAVAGLAGFAAFVLGFVAHVIVNRIFRVGFTNSQIALGLTVFSVCVLGFIASWLFDPHFVAVDVVIGLVGFGAIIACFILYIVINYGVRGSYGMIQRMHAQGRRNP